MRVIPLITAFLIILSGCSGGGGGSDTNTGSLTDSGIRGLSYQTQSQTGKTDDAGRFKYYPGETLSFAIGDLPLASGVPAKRYVSPLQFVPDVRMQLDTAITDDLGLRSHQLVESQVVDNPQLVNLTRLLLTMDSNGTISEGDNITIEDRAINRFNALLVNVGGNIDFSQPVEKFAQVASEATQNKPATEASLINKIVSQICLESADNELCENPPTLAEIEAAPATPEADEDRVEGVEYHDELETRRSRILSAVRTVDEIQLSEVKEYLLREVDAITVQQTNNYYLSKVTANIKANDTALKEVAVRKVDEDINLGDIEAVSTNDSAVVIQSFNAQTGTVEFFVDGEAGEESTIFVNFKPMNNYRWLRKSLRVVIE